MKDEEKYLCKKCKRQVYFVGERENKDIYYCKKCSNFFTKDELKRKRN